MQYKSRYHHQNLTDGRLPLWRHGRAWWGYWNWEWSVLYHPRLGIRFSKGGYDDNSIQGSIDLLLFSLHVGRKFGRFFEERELSLYWYQGSVWLNLWADDNWGRDRPWHRNTICFHVEDWVKGKPEYSDVAGESFETYVPMPEGCYLATATPHKRTWRRKRWFKTERDSVDLKIEGGIPFAGKGENSWDCGDDGLWGTGGETLEKAIGNVVASVLEYRKRYGYDSKGTGKEPATVLNAERANG